MFTDEMRAACEKDNEDNTLKELSLKLKTVLQENSKFQLEIEELKKFKLKNEGLETRVTGLIEELSKERKKAQEFRNNMRGAFQQLKDVVGTALGTIEAILGTEEQIDVIA